jgi:hypothetical protein
MIPKRVPDKIIDWAQKFDEALGTVRKASKRAGITAKKIDEAVRTSQNKADR